jgi:hypothetical protein
MKTDMKKYIKPKMEELECDMEPMLTVVSNGDPYDPGNGYEQSDRGDNWVEEDF